MKATYIEDYFKIPIKIGDTIMTGRFRNKPVKVKEIGIDEISKRYEFFYIVPFEQLS